MVPEQVAFFLTFKCNFECNHCSVSCSPKRQEVLRLDTIKNILDQAYIIPSLRVVVFTGGEPTLHWDTLCQAIAYATEKGFVTRLVTNVWWADTITKAERILGDLCRSGLSELNISYDDFHAPYLSHYGGEQNVINAVRVALRLGITVLIGAVVYPGARVRTEYLRNMVKEINTAEEVLFMEDFFNRLGRAKKKIPSHLYFNDQTELQQTSGCIEAGRVISILPDGKITMCCGHAVVAPEAQDIFCLGYSKNNNLSQQIKRMQRNVLYWWLHLEGPKVVLNTIGVKSKKRPCEICYLLGTTYREKLRMLAVKKEDIFNQLIATTKNANIST